MPPTAIEVRNAILNDAYRIPSITAYNRLEASPRTADFTRSLKAEIRDALWMLTRQWQFGEFEGEDAASPVSAQILGRHTSMDKVQFPGNREFPYDVSVPLETQVEREVLGGGLFVAVQMARYFARLMRDNGLTVHFGRFSLKYKLQYAIDPNDRDGLQLFRAVDDQLFDGYKLYGDIVTPHAVGTKFQKWLSDEGLSTPDRLKFDTIADQYKTWFKRNYSQPSGTAMPWLPSRLEYQFAVSSPTKVLNAEHYSEGHLDWYSFDLVSDERSDANASHVATVAEENLVSFIPAPIAFKGMPNPRFWTMEENQIDFGKIDTTATGLLHLLLAEFGLIYSNDWFMLPYPLRINTLCEISGISILDVFGQYTLVRPAGRGEGNGWQRWVMFRNFDAMSTNGDSNLFYLVPAVSKALEGEPLERVNFLRDEMANLVWAVENSVPSQAGSGVSGDELARKSEAPETFAPFNASVLIRYVTGTTVPDNWIPFIPVHQGGSIREIRFQRAKMPKSKGPLGSLLTEKAAPYYINEEEVPRSGVIVQRSFQRARWLNGKTYLWVGRSKTAGKGEGWSNLEFDQIRDIPQNTA